jgi:hypothetical protein
VAVRKVRDADGEEKWRDVVTGRSDGESVEIFDGLKEGERVLTKPVAGPMRFLPLPVLLLAFAVGCASSRSHAPTTAPAPKPYAREIARGVEFIVQHQNPDGSWGTGLETRGYEIYSMVPGSHDAFRVATTALCVMALREAAIADPSLPGVKPAYDNGVNYLVESGQARRDSGDLLYNVWAHTYALEALAIEMRENPDPRIAAAAQWNLDRMIRYSTYMGGWNYYDFGAQTQQPSLAPTSFGTAAGMVALWEARKSGLGSPKKLGGHDAAPAGGLPAPEWRFLIRLRLPLHPSHPGKHEPRRRRPHAAGQLRPVALGRARKSDEASRAPEPGFVLRESRLPGNGSQAANTRMRRGTRPLATIITSITSTQPS